MTIDRDNKRYYTHVDHPSIPVGEEWPSVTTVCGVMSKVWMAPWAAKRMYLEIEEKLRGFKENQELLLDHSDILAIAKKAKSAWRTKRDTAGHMGTFLHDVAEMITKGEEVPAESPQEWVEKFKAWMKEHRIRPVSTEQAIAIPALKTAGRYDLIANTGGKCLTLVDYKTGAHPGETVLPQAVTYADGARLEGLKVTKVAVLHCPLDAEWSYKVYNLKDMDWHRKAFAAMRTAFAWREKMEEVGM